MYIVSSYVCWAHTVTFVKSLFVVIDLPLNHNIFICVSNKSLSNSYHIKEKWNEKETETQRSVKQVLTRQTQGIFI